MADPQAGLAQINHADIYYEVAGSGQPLIMIHAGVADSRQWNNEFQRFSAGYRAVRYDLRGFGKSEPVDAEFSHLRDLEALIAHLEIEDPMVLMGCSMGGGLAMDFALAHPSMVKALVMVDSGPSDLRLDVPSHPMAEAAETAYKAGNLDLVAELETQIWFDGMDRTAADVDRDMRALAYEMNRLALSHDAKHLGQRLPDSEQSAVDSLKDIEIPLLMVVGEHDIPFMHAAADVMLEAMPQSRKVVIEDAAHLPNMDHPAEFQAVVADFLDDIGQ